MPKIAHMNVLPLGSYRMLLGMDWLYLRRTKAYWCEKAIKCLDANGETRIMQGKNKPTSVSMVTAMQANRSCRKGFVMAVAHISSDKGKDVENEKIFKR